MRAVLLCLLPLLPACIGASHECQNFSTGVFDLSTDASSGDHPEYVDTYSSYLPLATAVNGAQRFRAENLSCDDTEPLILTSVRSDDPTRATVTFTDSTFVFRPLVAGNTGVEVKGDGASTSDGLTAAAIADVVLVGKELGEPGAFYVDTVFPRIELRDSTGAPLVDNTLSIVSDSFDLGDKWNHLDLNRMPAGQYSLAVNAGDRAWPLDVTLVDHISGVVPAKPTVDGVGNEPTDVCFFAYLDNVLVAGVPWQFELDSHDGKVSTDRTNCVTVTDAPGAQHDIHAEALGFTAAAVVEFH